MTTIAEPTRTPTSVELELPSAGAFRPVGRLVLGGFAARLGLTVDRIADLQLALDVVCARIGQFDRIELMMSEVANELRVEIGPLASDARCLKDVERLVSDLVDDVSACDFGQHAWLTLRVGRPSLPDSNR